MRYKYSYDYVKELFRNDDETPPFLFYFYEDKSGYKKATECTSPYTDRTYIDVDDDFLVGESGGILLNINFSFINTHLFRQAAINFNKNTADPDYVRWVKSLDVPTSHARNKYFYCPAKHGTKEYIDFWRTEEERRSRGMIAPCKLLDSGEIVDVRIPGNLYHFLNYSRIKRNLLPDEKAAYEAKGLFKVKSKEDFPFFWDGHYWKSKLEEFAIRNDMNTCDAKARRKGYSYWRGGGAANTINLIPNITIAIGASDEKYLTGRDATNVMVKRNLDWLELNTHWKRFFISEDLMNIKLGYKLKKTGNIEYGYKSGLLGATLYHNANGFVGKGAAEIDIEEAGVCDNLEEVIDITVSATESGAEQIGIFRLYGTGGLEEADWIGFSKAYYGPSTNRFVPMENVFDYNSRQSLSGFFHPQILNLYPYMDIDGNSDLVEAWKYDKADKERQKSALSTSRYIIYAGQRANRPEEAFRRSKDNIFVSPSLYDHIKVVTHNPELRTWVDGMPTIEDGKIVYKPNAELSRMGYAVHPYIERYPIKSGDDRTGCFRRFHEPITIDGKVPPELYFGVYDPVAKDKVNKKQDSRDSLESFYICGNPYNKYGFNVPLIALSYCGRMDQTESVHRYIGQSLDMYGAKCLPEVDRGNIVTHYRNWQWLYKLYKNPLAYINNKIIQGIALEYGITIGEGTLASDGLLYLKDLLYQPIGKAEDGTYKFMFHTIVDLPFLLELSLFDREHNFDRISAARIIPFMLMYLKKHYSESTNGTNKPTTDTFLKSLNAY